MTNRNRHGYWTATPRVHARIGDEGALLRVMNEHLGGVGIFGATVPKKLGEAAHITLPVSAERHEDRVGRMWDAYASGAFMNDPTPGFLICAIAAGARYGTLYSGDFAPGNSETYDHMRWHADRFDTHWIVDWRRDGDGQMRTFALHRPTSEPFHVEDRQLFRLLCGHTLLAEKLAARSSIEVADAAPEPVFLVDDRLRLHHANAAAERLLSRNDGFRLDYGLLGCADAKAQAELSRAAREAAQLRGPPDDRFVAMPRTLGASPHIIAIGSARLPVAGTSGTRSAARLSVIDFASAPPAPVLRRYQALFGLTDAELAVAAALMAEGDPLPRIALRCGISYNTVRTHITRLLAKTGTSSQTALIRLLSRLD